MTTQVYLVLAACQYPGGLLERSRRPKPNGPLTDSANLPGPSDHAFRRWLHRNSEIQISQSSRADLVMTGDQIYVDATAGLFDPRQRDAPLERAYATLGKEVWRNMAIENFKHVALMDDHEVGDNWEPSAHVARNSQLEADMAAAISLFLQKQRGIEHPPARPSLFGPAQLLSGHCLFIGDSRTERSVRDARDLKAARIMSSEQMGALVSTLGRAPAAAWKFVATSSILLPRRLTTVESTSGAAIRSDAWDGYPSSLHEVLGHIVDCGLKNCVFLSGDEHIPCVAEITLQRNGVDRTVVKLWSVHAGALYAPYPFANAVPEDFAEMDSFDFVSPSGASWTATVVAYFPEHLDDGFLEITGTDGAPLEVVFRSAHGADRDHAFAHLI
ncbi:MAG: alkaline phosphatase D family protein [Acidovorax sp.]